MLKCFVVAGQIFLTNGEGTLKLPPDGLARFNEYRGDVIVSTGGLWSTRIPNMTVRRVVEVLENCEERGGKE